MNVPFIINQFGQLSRDFYDLHREAPGFMYFYREPVRGTDKDGREYFESVTLGGDDTANSGAFLRMCDLEWTAGQLVQQLAVASGNEITPGPNAPILHRIAMSHELTPEETWMNLAKDYFNLREQDSDEPCIITETMEEAALKSSHLCRAIASELLDTLHEDDSLLKHRLCDKKNQLSPRSSRLRLSMDLFRQLRPEEIAILEFIADEPKTIDDMRRTLWKDKERQIDAERKQLDRLNEKLFQLEAKIRVDRNGKYVSLADVP